MKKIYFFVLFIACLFFSSLDMLASDSPLNGDIIAFRTTCGDIVYVVVDVPSADASDAEWNRFKEILQSVNYDVCGEFYEHLDVRQMYLINAQP